MDKFAENVYRLCEEAQPYTYVLAIVALMVIAAMFIIPSEEGRQKAKKALPWVVVGVVLMLGAVYCGEMAYRKDHILIDD